jgi:folylpolyglutamate synthase/dihydropteroate synthase
MASGQLLAQWQAANMQATDKILRSRELVSPSVASAVERAKQQLLSHGADAVICVTGSLHAVASALLSGFASNQ